jgi:uncharacterized membrane protein
MIACSAPCLRPRTHGLMATLLLVLVVVVAAPLQASLPLHVHEADSAGIYNEEHVLASLDSRSADAPLSDAGPAVFVALVASACPLALGVQRAAPVPGFSDSRAPPSP